MKQYPILDQIDGLSDFMAVPESQLPALAAELRGFLLETVAQTGGHLASNLGAVELIMAIHRVFPGDRVLFDVGHQAYAHKILTGRRERFSSLRQEGGVSGFPKREEGDDFIAGHASTSISAALGFARARALTGGKEAVAALIGDGALTGGMAFEALNDAGQSRLPIVVVLNDNDMSISRNVGALNRYLGGMRTSSPYQKLKQGIVRALDSGRLGQWLSRHMERLKNRIKYFLLPNVMFEAMGFTYLGPVDGHDIPALIKVLGRARALNRPVIVHAVTKKGKGYSPAEAAPEQYHGVKPFVQELGVFPSDEGISNSEVFGQKLMELAARDERIVAVSAAMPAGTGLLPFAKAYPGRFFDVGIAEGHAVTMAAGMAAGGLRPVVAVYSTFLQRAYDSILHDVCLQKLPVVFAVDRAGLVGEDGATHQGAYDIAYLSSMPGIRIYSPASRAELEAMLEEALKGDGPSAIRYPRGALVGEISGPSIPPDRWQILRPFAPVTVLAAGRMVERALPAAEYTGAGLVNARILRPLDDDLLEKLSDAGVKAVLTLEDGIAEGGFGARVAARLTGIVVRSMGLPDTPVAHGTVEEQFIRVGLTGADIERTIRELERSIL